MKSVYKETFKGYFSSYRQSSCLKRTLVHTYFTENYAQDNVLFLTTDLNTSLRAVCVRVRVSQSKMANDI